MEACASDLGDASHITCLVIVFFSFAQISWIKHEKNQIILYLSFMRCAFYAYLLQPSS